MPPSLRPGSDFRRWVAIIVRSLRTVWGVGLAVGGTVVLGSGLALVLHGLEFRALDLTEPTAEALSVGLVTILIGGFMLGLAMESSLRAVDHRLGTQAWEIAVTTAVALFFFIPLNWVLAGLAGRLGSFSELFDLIPDQLYLVGRSGIFGGLAVGVPLVWLFRQFWVPRRAAVASQGPAILYVAWLVAFIVVYHPPLPG